MRIPSQIIIQTTCREPVVITYVQFLEGLPPRIWEGQKTVQIFSQFLTTFDLSRISPEQIHKSKIEKVIDQLRPLPRWAKKSCWTLVHKRKIFWREYWPTVVRIFRQTVFSLLRGGCALKFLHALEIDQGYLAHTPVGTGVPQKNFNRENLKFGLKFRVYTSIISALYIYIFLSRRCASSHGL